MYYVSESVYHHTHWHGVAPVHHSTLLTAFLCESIAHFTIKQTKRTNSQLSPCMYTGITLQKGIIPTTSLYYKFQIKTSLASDRTHCQWAITVSPRGEGPISSSSSIANDQNEDEDQNEDGKTKTKAKNKEQNNHHHRNFNLSFKLMAVNNKINRTLTRMYTVEHWA